MLVCARCGQENPEVARFCLACGAPLAAAAAPRETRKTVTVVFTDVTGSTSLGERLDPESLRHVMTRYFEAMKTVLERHGGTVEKFIGDAVMAVFGIPAVHEDDALRAVRAAAEMRDALAALNHELERDRGVTILARTGVNTGQVVAGDPSAGQRLVTGDAVNVAARLEQAAVPGELLLGDSTWRLVREAVTAEPVPPLAVKGKAEPIRAHRLVAVGEPEDAAGRRYRSPMVGRQRPLALLRQTFDSSVADRACHLFTVLGSAGVGKSRLVHEFVAGLPPEALVLRGRCLPYGDGITYWPLHEVFGGAAGIHADDRPEDALVRLWDLGWDEALTDRIAQVLGLSAASAPAEEIAWAARRALETMASARPVVVVIDDIHWAEPTLLDLLEHLVDLSRDAPILLVCIARPELLDDRPGWGGGKLNAISALLQPLTENESGDLIENLLGQARLETSARARIADAAGGNPLFVEQILSMLIDDGLLARTNGHWTPTGDLSRLEVPPTIQALLSARLDRLDREERHVIECASVVGKTFYRGAVTQIAPEAVRPHVPAHLTSLVRKELIRPDRSDFEQEDAYRFLHILIRDAAYEGMPKAERANLHEAMVGWLSQRAGERAAEYEEIVAYHLEQPHRYLGELGPVDQRGRELADRAASLLAAGGRRALVRSDLPASINLLERALALMPTDDSARTELLVDLGIAASDAGAYAKAEAAITEAIEWAEAKKDDRLRAHAVCALFNLKLMTNPSLDLDDAQRQGEQAREVLERSGDDRGVARALNALAWMYNMRLRTTERAECLERAVMHARRAGARREELEALYYLSSPILHGPMPAEEGLRRLDKIREQSGGDRRVESSIQLTLAALEAMRGRFDEARQAATESVVILEELGHRPQAEASRGESFGFVESMAGDLAAAERAVRRACETLQALGETGIFSTQAADLALILCEQGRFDEAKPFIDASREATASGDVLSQARWRQAQARVLAHEGHLDGAMNLAREAVQLIGSTDVINMQADTHVELSRALQAAGRRTEAARALERALALYEQKGNVVSAERTREKLADLGGR